MASYSLFLVEEEFVFRPEYNIAGSIKLLFKVQFGFEIIVFGINLITLFTMVKFKKEHELFVWPVYTSHLNWDH